MGTDEMLLRRTADAMAWKLDLLYAEGHGREAVRLAFGPPRPPEVGELAADRAVLEELRARVVSNAVLVAGLVPAGNPTLRVSVEGGAELWSEG